MTLRTSKWIHWLGLAAANFAVAHSHATGAVPAPTNNPAKWEPEIRAYEQLSATNPPSKGGILFVGSSSIRLWKTLTNDFAGLPVYGRGFGGSTVADSLHFADRLIIPHQPRMVLLYAGDNDIAAGRSPEQVFSDFQAFVAKIHQHLPQTRIAFIAIKPSPSRWHLVDQVKSANQLIADWIKTDPRLRYIDVYTPMLGDDGKPRAELFVSDRLHLNERGYRLWTEILKPNLK